MAKQKGKNASSLDQQIESLLSELRTDPDKQKLLSMLNKLRDPRYRDILSKVSSATGLATALAGIGEGISQRKLANEYLDELKRPEFPAPQTVDPALSRLISRAELSAVSPQRTGILDSYQDQLGRATATGLASAREASGGQSGRFGSAAQSIYNQRLRNALNLPALTDQISQKYLGLAGNIASSKASADNYATMNNLNRARMLFDQYNRESEAAAKLYQSGSKNLYGGINFGLDKMQSQIADMLYNSRNKTGIPELDEQASFVDESLSSRFMPTKVNKLPIGVAPTTDNIFNIDYNQFRKSNEPPFGTGYYYGY